MTPAWKPPEADRQAAAAWTPPASDRTPDGGVVSRAAKAFTEWIPKLNAPDWPVLGPQFRGQVADFAHGVASLPGQTWDALSRTGQAMMQDNPNKVAWEAAGAVPVLGHMTQQFTQDIAEGNYPEAFGHGANIAATVFGPKLLEESPRAGPRSTGPTSSRPSFTERFTRSETRSAATDLIPGLGPSTGYKAKFAKLGKSIINNKSPDRFIPLPPEALDPYTNPPARDISARLPQGRIEVMPQQGVRNGPVGATGSMEYEAPAVPRGRAPAAPKPPKPKAPTKAERDASARSLDPYTYPAASNRIGMPAEPQARIEARNQPYRNPDAHPGVGAAGSPDYYGGLPAPPAAGTPGPLQYSDYYATGEPTAPPPAPSSGVSRLPAPPRPIKGTGVDKYGNPITPGIPRPPIVSMEYEVPPVKGKVSGKGGGEPAVEPPTTISPTAEEIAAQIEKFSKPAPAAETATPPKSAVDTLADELKQGSGVDPSTLVEPGDLVPLDLDRAAAVATETGQTSTGILLGWLHSIWQRAYETTGRATHKTLSEAMKAKYGVKSTLEMTDKQLLDEFRATQKIAIEKRRAAGLPKPPE